MTVDKKGQFHKKTAFYVRLGNATREITDADERHKYVVDAGAPPRRPPAGRPDASTSWPMER